MRQVQAPEGAALPREAQVPRTEEGARRDPRRLALRVRGGQGRACGVRRGGVLHREDEGDPIRAENVNKSTSTKSYEGKGTPMGEIRVASRGKADTDTGDE